MLLCHPAFLTGITMKIVAKIKIHPSSWLMFILLFFVVLCPTYANTDAKPLTVNIGIYAPFSGEFKIVGNSMLNAMKLARDNLKDNQINYQFYPINQPADDKNAEALLTAA